MFLKIGDRILNTDHIVQGHLHPQSGRCTNRNAVQLVMTGGDGSVTEGIDGSPNLKSPKDAMNSVLTFWGPEADALRAFYIDGYAIAMGGNFVDLMAEDGTIAYDETGVPVRVPVGESS